MRLDDTQVKEILLKGNYIGEEDAKKAEEFAKTSGGSIAYLLSQELVTQDLVGQAIAESLGVPYVDLNSRPPTKEQVLKIPEESAKKLRVVLFEEGAKKLTVVTDDPKNAALAAELTAVFPGKTISIAYSLSKDIDQMFTNYQKPLETRFSKIIEGKKRVAPELLEEIFRDAYTLHASDIHFEPQKKEVVIRFRIDGVLREAGRVPHEQYENILNRIKVESNLRIDEHFAAQDGSLRYESANGVSFDLRTSIVPTVYGEKTVFRVLAAYVEGFSLNQLGITAHHEEIIMEAVSKPFGMILVTGPTGSGKTTMLYGVLHALNTPDVNITTIEDPVEYKMVGINQIQVNPATNLTFPKGLRSIVRQDPDIILVGEIRDNETAEIAVNAALTGHLLLSTFHANDAATAIPRLLDMGIEPFLLSSTIEIIASQRLLRKICEHCRYSAIATKKDWEKYAKKVKGYFPEAEVTLYRGKGCSACGGSGYEGRIAIREFIQMTSEMRELILKNPSARQIEELARTQGAQTMFDDGIEKVKNGVTTLDELLRVAQPPVQ
ncbi:MAG TPA: ATPase, T2SS/T4P/T4SS family [Candidatus Paceibacterota bacterium]|nr:ATPase, T2SS/T4P/T4SS family [Candidatus Paceibacterota bacterium]